MIGVYYLTDRDGEPLYVGSSRNVERRIREHRRGEWGGEIGGVETYACDSWAEALRLERCLIADLSPRENRQGRDPIDCARTFEEFVAACALISGIEVAELMERAS